MGSLFTTALAPFIMLLVSFVILPFMIKKIWPFMVKSLFPRAVEENYVSENMSWPIAIVIGFIILGSVF
jgi:hypothetical protein